MPARHTTTTTTTAATTVAEDRRLSLRADCARCAGLCCVAPAFSASADFAIDKAAAQPCPNLGSDFGCGIHNSLRESGFPGCTAYDCFGAGQRVVQGTFAGNDWRRTPGIAREMFESYGVMRQLHELLWYLSEALSLAAARQLHDGIRRLAGELEHLASLEAPLLAVTDLTSHWLMADELLSRASEMARAQAPGQHVDRRGADLVGADLRGADLRAASLRGSYLLRADLRDADLKWADVIGADMRGADLSGADLTGSIFLVQSQVDSATGNTRTRLPGALRRPNHWVNDVVARPGRK